MIQPRRHPESHGFTLVELLVVIAIIAMLVSIILPSLASAKDLARSTQCLSNLRSCGKAMTFYQLDHTGSFWPVRFANDAGTGKAVYFWGAKTDPVDASASPFMNYLDDELAYLWCPKLKWGDYVPQGAVNEPTTTYGYNAYTLGQNASSTIRAGEIQQPTELFVLADAGMYWAPGGVAIFQNSTYLEHVTGTWVQTPSNHFRHQGRSNALCADGHAAGFGPEGWDVNPETNLGFVGTSNDPHYKQ